MSAYLPLLTFTAMAAVISAFVISLYRRSRKRWGPAPVRLAAASDAADFDSPFRMTMPSGEFVAASADAGSMNCADAGGGASADFSGSSGDGSSCGSFDSGGSFSD